MQVLGEDGSTKIHHPHYIKAKSKTNANPTRKNSPRFSGKFSVSHGINLLRDSNNSKTTKNANKLPPSLN